MTRYPNQTEMKNATFRPTMSNMYYPLIPMDEQFRQVSWFIPKYEDYYWISNYGRVYNQRTGYLITTSINNYGYEVVSLRVKDSYVVNNDKYVGIGVHILVCSAFVGPKPTPLHQVNHKDYRRTNNHYTNLEWVTSQENLEHSRKAGHYWNGEAYSSSKFTPEQIHGLCKLLESGITDPNTLSMMIFNEPVKPRYYAIIQDLRSGVHWPHITSQYNIPPLEKRNFTDDSYIHMFCQYFSANPGSIHDPSVTLQKVMDANGIVFESIDPKIRRRLSSAFNQLRYKNAYKKISSQYTIVE